MLALKIVFIILAAVSLALAVIGAVSRRKNIGFIITSLLIMGCDMICIAILGVDNAGQAQNVLLPYYILHALIPATYIFMVILVDRNRKHFYFMIPACVVSLYQVAIIISQYFGRRILLFSKKIFFKNAFWVAVMDSKNDGLFFSFRSYMIAMYIQAAIGVIILILCIRKSNRIFRTRYYVFLIISAIYISAEILKYSFSIPIWMLCIVYNIISAVCLYFTGVFSRNRLREWSLDSFANDMSDGLILYDKYNDLIHINDMIRNTLDKELVEEFRNIDKLTSWLEENRDPENEGIVKYISDDEERFFRVTVKEIGGSNSKVGTLYILHDNTNTITRIKAMERANEELERASRMKSDFLANMSHEIRTPMNAVIGMAEIAIREDDHSRIIDSLLQIQSSGKNLLNIINDILDYSKIESGKMEIMEEDYVPFTELQEIVNILSTRIGDKNLELYMLTKGILPHKLHADAMRIRQIIINLANNAIKFTKEGSVVIVIRCDPAGEGMVEMTVHVLDTGIGIRKEDIGKLFVSFQQLDSKRNRKVEGTGLGLAISQKLVQAMGGTIGVESEYGKGSDFWFKIPVKVTDPANDIKIEKADEKYAFVINEKDILVHEFVDEMENLRVNCRMIRSLDEYVPTGRKDYIFIEEYLYIESTRKFFTEHPDVTGVVLVGLSSEFKPAEKNVHIMHRPETTMNMVNILNGIYTDYRLVDRKKAFTIDFTAPDANILVVDDNAINISIVEGLIAPMKLKIEEADGGRQAIEKALNKDYDIIFMDHMMPEIDGVDATRQIREAREKEGRKQPVIIALSANAMEEARKLFAEAGMNDFVAKPVDVRILTAKIKEWLPPEKIIEKVETVEEDTGSEIDKVTIKVDEIDVETAVKGFGSAALFEKIAKEYYITGEGKLADIRESFTNEDWEGYTIKVHALKSSSRQIGAMALGDEAEALEKAGKAGDIETIRAETEPLLQHFAGLLNKMKEFCEDKEELSDKPLIDKELLDSLLSDMEEACDDLDMDRMEGIRDKLSEYSYDEAVAGFIKTLSRAVSDMDTDICTEIIGSIRTVL